jgi:hypothetical protein
MLDNDLVEELQLTSIAATGKVFEDLHGEEIDRLMHRLADDGRWELFGCLFLRLLQSAVAARDGSEEWQHMEVPSLKPRVVTQQEIRAAITNENGGRARNIAEDELRQALRDGASVEPGPLIAFLQRMPQRGPDGKQWVALSVRVRARSSRRTRRPAK